MSTAGFQNQSTLKASHDAAMAKVDELTAQLKDERMKSLDLEKQLQSSTMVNIRTKLVSAALQQGFIVIIRHFFIVTQGPGSLLISV